MGLSMKILLNITWLFHIVYGTCTDNDLENLDWWQTTVIYQVYPRSFKDSDGDGIGDLRGIEEMAEHFVETGIRTVWLSPIFKSPMVDFGYDISDFVSIDSTFGTMDDFLSLQQKLKSLNVHILLDFVPNHSSDEHEWFNKSVHRIYPYTNYYVWLDGKVDENGYRVPPNNWRSFFGGSAWEWSSERGQYYFHQFTAKQPDFNFRFPAVLEEMKNVLRFWLDLGIDGFRIDAPQVIIEDSLYRDDPLVNSSVVDDGYSYDFLNHIHSSNQPETFKIIEEFRAVLDEYTHRDGITRVMLTEVYGSLRYTMMFYSAETLRAHMPFNFNFITKLDQSSSAVDIKNVINRWLKYMPPGQWANWVFGNHDNHRVASKFGQDMVDPINTLLLMLPGTAVTYNGEEIGMTDGTIRWDQTVDPWARSVGQEKYEAYSRDPYRTPFHWNDSYNAGFSTSKYTWLPVNSNHSYLNLASQKLCLRSHYQTYKRLVQLRSSPTLMIGDLTMYTPSDLVLIFTRKLEGHETFIIILNVGTEQEMITLRESIYDVPAYVIVRVSSINAWQVENDVFDTTCPFPLGPKSSLVLSY